MSGRVQIIGLYIRLLGALCLFVMADTAAQWRSLCGVEGLLPIDVLAERMRSAQAPWHVLRLPSLFWIEASDRMGGALIALGALGSLLMILDRGASYGLSLFFASWLSIVNMGGDFFAYPWDTFLLELAFVSLFLSRYRSPGFPGSIAAFAVMLVGFRLWFSMGMVKVLFNNEAWRDLEFLSYFLPNQPMPTPFAWHLARLPDALLRLGALATLALELAAPWLILSSRTRPFAALIFIAFSMLIHGTGNYAWFNLLAAVAAVPLFLGTSIEGVAARVALRRRRDAEPKTPHPIMRSRTDRAAGFVLSVQILFQVVLLVLLVLPLGNRYLNFLNYVPYRSEVQGWAQRDLWKSALIEPFRMASSFRIANPMGVFKGIAWRRWDLEFQVSAPEAPEDFRSVPLRFAPGTNDRLFFYAPAFPRFDQQLFYEAQQGSFFLHNTLANLAGEPPLIWTRRLLLLLWDGGNRTRYFESDPLRDAPAGAVRVVVKEQTFQSGAEHARTGGYWNSRVVYMREFRSKIEIERDEGALIPSHVYEDLRKHERPGR